MNNISQTDKGSRGEGIAAGFLVKNGFSVLDQNFGRKWGELDIIAKKNNELHFVEVKTLTAKRSGFEHYGAEDKIDSGKKRRLRRIIETYLLEKNVDENVEWFVDVIAVYIDPNNNDFKIEFFEDVII